MEAKEILNLHPGVSLDIAITEVMSEIADLQATVMPYTTNPESGIAMWQFAADAFGDVLLIKFTDAPLPIRDHCIIRDIEDKELGVDVASRDWMESLGKAILLFFYGHYGDYQNSDWTEVITAVPTRYAN